jgi:hypothetical protein
MSNKILSPLFVLLMVLSLAACSSLQLPGSQAEAEPDQADGAAAQPGQPLEDRLALGTLALEGTDQAVTPEQAAALLPLWKAVRSLSASDTASADEIAALYDQIAESMTPEQVQAIQNMEVSPEDMQALMQKYGVEFQAPEGASNPGDLSEEERATRIARFQAQGGGRGEFAPGGAPPEGGSGPGGFPGGALPEGGGGVFRPDAQGTPGAPMGGRPFRGGMNLRLVEPLIELLEDRASG